MGTGWSGRSLRVFGAESNFLVLGPDKPVPIFLRCLGQAALLFDCQGSYDLGWTASYRAR